MMKIQDVAKEVTRFSKNEELQKDNIISAHLFLVCDDGSRCVQISKGIIGNMFGEISQKIIKGCLANQLEAIGEVGHIASMFQAKVLPMPTEEDLSAISDILKSFFESRDKPAEEKH